MKEADVERSFFERLDAQLPNTLVTDIPGKFFSASKIPDEWIEPRLPQFRHRLTTRPNQDTDHVSIAVRCFVQRGKKGGRYLKLSELIDKVRAVVDITEGATAFDVLDENDAVVGSFQPRMSTVTRQRNQSIVIGESSLISVDIGIIRGEATLIGC